MTDPLFTIDSRYAWRYADDRLEVSDAANATLIQHGETAGRVADGLQMLDMAGVYMQPILSLLWHAMAAGAAGLIVPAHEGPAREEPEGGRHGS